jgi:hypothetical protein
MELAFVSEMKIHNKELAKNLMDRGFAIPIDIPEGMVFLPDHNKRIYSQNGEDGVTLAIFDVIGFTNKKYLEFGATDIYNNSQVLHEKHGFTGVLWNGSNTVCSYSQIFQEFITVENIKELCAKYEVPAEPDFVSIDIDGNDWHIWREMNKVCRPRVLVIEHTGQFPPGQDCVMPYKADHVWDGTNYCGASIEAMLRLGRHIGYSLVCSDNMGVNLFFVRDDLEPEKKFFGTNNLRMLYRIPKCGLPWRIGHPEDPQNRVWTSAAKLIKSEDVVSQVCDSS